ncbi:uncharacterized protein AMSG_01546 [Thecamonas trahens ATCC 50062]|uniref:Uncharacterized protein n=1 Tax=Thecamonas trahens ATCC 50062 TaxID=461836 RepID=A0A0L0DQZ8_THETB|nr:hypothetical protein AMSG_01546 [Thecamonas trahens ATCC 50062]KNC54695.1 hypothetical protein AMSG_01546 [Thecamonas trahens ATCC 50062]|eukprot:XP_013761597.1 hypothetical protein AMSG_01546 [Thecamonas trahens ATCC 50062]
MFHSYRAVYQVAAPKETVASVINSNIESIPKVVNDGMTEDRSRNSIIVNARFYTASCKWLDTGRFEMVDTRGGETLILAYAESTNFCCSWCPSCIRSCFACCNFDDWGKNEAHIDDTVALLAQQGGATKLMGARGGDLDDLLSAVSSSDGVYTFSDSSDAVPDYGSTSQ